MIIDTGNKTIQSPPYCIGHLSMNPVKTTFLVPPLRTPPSKEDRTLSRKQEEGIMERIGGRRQPASGAFRDKGDGRLHNHLRMEAKFTRSKQFVLRQGTMSKLRSECSDTEYPLLVIDFKHRNGVTYDQLAVLPFDKWEKMHAATFDNS